MIFASSGFLDAAVDAFHALTGLPGGGRESAPRDQYAMSLERGGSTAWSLEEDELLLGDLPLTAMMTVLDEGADQPGIAARFTLELPTGSESRGSGSGGWDTAAGVVLEAAAEARERLGEAAREGKRKLQEASPKSPDSYAFDDSAEHAKQAIIR